MGIPCLVEVLSHSSSLPSWTLQQNYLLHTQQKLTYNIQSTRRIVALIVRCHYQDMTTGKN